jgi:hypothetical protein
MSLIRLAFTASLAIILISCGERDAKIETQKKTAELVQAELSEFVESDNLSEHDLSRLVTQGIEAPAVDVIDGATDNVAMADKVDSATTNSVTEVSKLNLVEAQYSSIRSKSDDQLILDLREVISTKDQAISELSSQNQLLLNQLKKYENDRDEVMQNANKASTPEFALLKDQIVTMQSNLSAKSTELDALKAQKKLLEEKLNKFEPQIFHPSIGGSDLHASETLTTALDRKLYSPSLNTGLDCQLSFDAVVTLQNGKNKEAFYTEFFLLDRNFVQILQDGDIYLTDYLPIESFEELWAQSRKAPFKFPGLQKRIRSLLQSEVSQGRGYRVRTDLDGAAAFDDLPARTFNLVGTASLGIVGVTWNLPISLLRGSNKVSLTLANASWSK